MTSGFYFRIALLAGIAILLVACSKAAPPEELSGLAYVCPSPKDAEVLEDHPGKCPKDGLELQPIRIVLAYSCLNNTAFIQEAQGKCVTDGTDLVPITASMFWVCSDAPGKHDLTPGKCGNGTQPIKKFEARPHGDHNPRHGGQLFMADDAWHHLEGTYPRPGLFRLFFYDDWTKPLGAAGFAARAIVKDSSGKEVAAVPLHAGLIANALEAQIPNASTPLSTTLLVRFKPGEPEKNFDFTFRAYSKDPAEPLKSTSTSEPEPPRTEPVSAAPVPDRPTLPAMDIIPTGTFQLGPIPASAQEILKEFDARRMELAEKIEQRAPLGEYWVPALRAKDLALALLNGHLSEIPSRQQAAAENAVGRLIRAAFAIDNFGDLGDFEKILSAHEEFALAANDLRTAYASIR